MSSLEDSYVFYINGPKHPFLRISNLKGYLVEITTGMKSMPVMISKNFSEGALGAASSVGFGLFEITPMFSKMQT